MSTYRLHFAKIDHSSWTETLYDENDTVIEQEVKALYAYGNNVATQEKLQEWADQWCLRRDIVSISNDFGYELVKNHDKLEYTPPPDLSEEERSKLKQELLNGNAKES
jgi:hypothetical protein